VRPGLKTAENAYFSVDGSIRERHTLSEAIEGSRKRLNEIRAKGMNKVQIMTEKVRPSRVVWEGTKVGGRACIDGGKEFCRPRISRRQVRRIAIRRRVRVGKEVVTFQSVHLDMRSLHETAICTTP